MATHKGNKMTNYSVNLRLYYSFSYRVAKLMSKSIVLDPKDEFIEGPCKLADVGSWAFSTRDYSPLDQRPRRAKPRHHK